MKTILAILFFGLTAQASCPDLTGTFVSNDQSATKLNVTQSEADGITTYTVNYTAKYGQEEFSDSLIMIADGATRSEDGDDGAGGITKYSVSFACNAGQLNQSYVESYTNEDGALVEKIEGSAVMKIDANNNFEYADQYTDLKGKVSKEVSIYFRQ